MRPEGAEPALDFDELLGRLSGDIDLLRDIAELYFTEYPKQFDDLRSAVAARDIKRIQQAAHKIKGTAKNFSAPAATECAFALEQTKEFGDGAAIAEMTEQLSRELHRLESGLKEKLGAL
jgi:HPt (histidine-containing phosphotransfer) domain-containing protein